MSHISSFVWNSKGESENRESDLIVPNFCMAVDFFRNLERGNVYKYKKSSKAMTSILTSAERDKLLSNTTGEDCGLRRCY